MARIPELIRLPVSSAQKIQRVQWGLQVYWTAGVHVLAQLVWPEGGQQHERAYGIYFIP